VTHKAELVPVSTTAENKTSAYDGFNKYSYGVKNFKKSGRVTFPYEHIFKASSLNVLESTVSLLKSKGYKTMRRHKTDYMYATGEIPVMLVAHVDTVHKAPPKKIYFDKEEKALWSYTGLGADDRAGVAMIHAVLNSGFKPYILLTNYEETGGKGAREAVKRIKPPAVNIVIELDRAWENDAVYYQCDNPKLEKYVNEFGFKTAHGSFTDICVLCPDWGIGGVNLSTGARRCHSPDEYLKVDEWEKTLKEVKKMLKSPPEEKMEYIKKTYDYGKYKGYSGVKSSYYDDWYDDWYDDLKYEKNKYEKNKGGVHVPTDNTQFSVHNLINVEELILYYGGKALDWEFWFAKNRDRLEEIVKKAVGDAIENEILKNIPDFVYD